MTPALPHTNRITYLAAMADHGRALAAAMRYFGMPVEMLPPPDPRSLDAGLRVCGGRECLPCFLTLGDILRKTESPGFVPERTAFLLPTTQGPCRFGQYGQLLRNALDDRGLKEVELVFPTVAVAGRGFRAIQHRGFLDYPVELRKLVWQGVVAVDLLSRLQLEHRPYETVRGAADAAYARGLDRIVAATEEGGGDLLLAAVRETGRDFGGLPVDRTDERPVVGMIGEIYVRWNAYANGGLVAEVERLGGEVVVASIAEMIYFSTFRMMEVARISGEYRDVLRAFLVDRYQRKWERRLRRELGGLLRRPDEAPMAACLERLRPYYDPALSTEATLSLARAIEFAEGGTSGILNVLPFACMPGVIVAGMAPRMRRDLGQIPWLDIPYDCQKQTNVRTRLEAFMHQVTRFQRRKGKTIGDGWGRQTVDAAGEVVA
jgi:predicted nucleotide-binding protein (sugar kinase/HSP70/actin superfamily)